MKKLHMPYIQITHAALNLYAAEGPKGVTMRKVAAAVGITAPAIYRHFRNKEALLDAVVGAADDRLAERLEPPHKQRRWVNRAEAVAGRAMEFAIAQPHLFQLISRRRPRWDRPGRSAETLQREVESGIAGGQLRPDDPKQVSAAIWAHLCGLVALRERGDLSVSPHPLRREWLASSRRLLHGLAAA